MINQDLNEINKFASVAHSWWDQNGEFKPLHDINPLRLNWINSQVNLAGKSVLDVGCGGGILTESMAKRGAIVTGIDLGNEVLEVAKLHKLESKLDITYHCKSAEDFAKLHPAQFDVITCLELLEHVPNPKSIINACYELAKPGAKLFFSTINRNFKSYLLAIVGAEYVLKMLTQGTHDYSKFITPAELALWCRDNKLDVTNITGLSYNPLFKNYKLTNDASVNYMLSASKQS